MYNNTIETFIILWVIAAAARRVNYHQNYKLNLEIEIEIEIEIELN